MAVSVTKFMQPTVLTTSAVALYTCPTNPSSSVLANGRVRFANTSGAAATVTAYIVPAAGTASASNAFMNAVSVAPNTYLDVDLPIMASGDQFEALAGTATAITCSAISGAVFS